MRNELAVVQNNVRKRDWEQISFHTLTKGRQRPSKSRFFDRQFQTAGQATEKARRPTVDSSFWQTGPADFSYVQSGGNNDRVDITSWLRYVRHRSMYGFVHKNGHLELDSTPDNVQTGNRLLHSSTMRLVKRVIQTSFEQHIFVIFTWQRWSFIGCRREISTDCCSSVASDVQAVFTCP